MWGWDALRTSGRAEEWRGHQPFPSQESGYLGSSPCSPTNPLKNPGQSLGFPISTWDDWMKAPSDLGFHVHVHLQWPGPVQSCVFSPCTSPCTFWLSIPESQAHTPKPTSKTHYNPSPNFPFPFTPPNPGSCLTEHD